MPKAVKNIPSSQNWTVLKVCNAIKSSMKCEVRGGRGLKAVAESAAVGGRSMIASDSACIQFTNAADAERECFRLFPFKGTKGEGDRWREGCARQKTLCIIVALPPPLVAGRLLSQTSRQ